MKPLAFLLPLLQNLRTQLPYLPRTFRLLWTAAPRWALAWAVLLLLQGVLPVAMVYVTRALVDRFVPVVGQGGSWAALSPVVLLAVVLAVLMLLSEALRSVSGWVRTAQAELVQDHVSGLIHAKVGTLDLSFYDSPDYHDQMHRARNDAFSRPMALLESMGGVMQNSLTLLAMAGILLQFGWWVPLLLLVSTLPAFLVVTRAVVRLHNWRQRTTPVHRLTLYYDVLLAVREAAAELRLFALIDHFRQAFQSLRKRLRLEHVQLAREQALAELAAGAFGIVIAGVVMVWVLWRSAQGQGTFGDVVLFYQAFYQGQRLLRTLLSSVSQVYSSVLFLENFFTFLDLEPRVTEPQQPQPVPTRFHQGIQFDHVTFRYPDSERTALDNFSLTVPAGQTVAIVGANGAGKSTLIKLLCRFYDPEAGSITLDGVDIRDLSLDALRRQITVLFQQPVPYETTVTENIAYGDWSTEIDMPAIVAAAEAAGADAPISRLPHGYDTVLGKAFGTADLSVGEWQRVALARAFLRQAELLILDEPTSAMDSWAEAAWLERFRELAAGRTVILITHRFTTAMHADMIHVMDEGRVIESGCHQALVDLGGRYAVSWTRQMASHHDGS